MRRHLYKCFGTEEADSKELEDLEVVNQTVEDLINLSAEQPLFKVSFECVCVCVK
jgi:hypothetical protein